MSPLNPAVALSLAFAIIGFDLCLKRKPNPSPPATIAQFIAEFLILEEHCNHLEKYELSAEIRDIINDLKQLP